MKRLLTLFVLCYVGPIAFAEGVLPDIREYTWNGQIFDSLHLAEEAMKNAEPPKRQFLERLPPNEADFLSNGDYRIRYEGRDPRMEPDPQDLDWRFFNYLHEEKSSFYNIGSESQSLQSLIDLYRNVIGGCDVIYAGATSEWVFIGFASGTYIPLDVLTQREEKSILLHVYGYQGVDVCSDSVQIVPQTLRREKYWRCPEGAEALDGGLDIYFPPNGDPINPANPFFCEVDVEDEILAKQIYADCNVEGNPCTVVAGIKVHSESDYQGPGISLNRSYESSMLGLSNALMGPGWGHSHASLAAQHPLTSTTAIGVSQPLGGTIPFVAAEAASSDFGSAGSSDSLYVLDANSGSGSTIDIRNPSGSSRTYKRRGTNNAGRMEYAEAGNGQRTVYQYQSGTRLTTAIGPFGHTLTFTYQYLPDPQRDRLLSIEDPAGEKIEYVYDLRGRLTSVLFADNSVKQYLYEGSAYSNHLTGIVDETGLRYSTYAYDDLGRTLSSERAGSVGQINLDWPSTSETQVTKINGSVKNYTHDDVGDLDIRTPALVEDEYGSRTMSYENSGRGRLLSTITERGYLNTFTYNSINRTGKTAAVGDPLERTINTGYDAASGKVNLIRTPSVFQPANEVKGSEK